MLYIILSEAYIYHRSGSETTYGHNGRQSEHKCYNFPSWLLPIDNNRAGLDASIVNIVLAFIPRRGPTELSYKLSIAIVSCVLRGHSEGLATGVPP